VLQPSLKMKKNHEDSYYNRPYFYYGIVFESV